MSYQFIGEFGTHHPSEHWIVVQGTANITTDVEGQFVTENQSVYTRLAAVHRMENLGKIPTVLIELQSGRNPGEDDILQDETRCCRGQEAMG
ncbi:mannose-1-phosphate guanylyltransferase/mannose-1-phosphate guanylyltransferase / mannose-6-phosphate isomerase [Roseivivax lentus]|uniref:Mannose-1-phosphate guanylyltransferase/mannose-1-phosphate guanylyltransferase / mannose-6-phosphate isomerase n=1 Tax=Roseivivax lentus TaxID=633194 RepID=A0A1N7P5N4_9RHOB|nr:mannose-1-phosphate guanylyltransferase/mannose-1-phosphate guanylyltransferase / mannose-6-phosphate isomerase [Roseivivax lentus]